MRSSLSCVSLMPAIGLEMAGGSYLSWSIGPAAPSCLCFRAIMQRRFQTVVCMLQLRHTQFMQMVIIL